MSEDPRIVAALAELLPAWAEELALRQEQAARRRQNGELVLTEAADVRDLAREALRDLELLGLHLVAVSNDLVRHAPHGAA